MVVPLLELSAGHTKAAFHVTTAFLHETGRMFPMTTCSDWCCLLWRRCRPTSCCSDWYCLFMEQAPDVCLFVCRVRLDIDLHGVGSRERTA